MTAPDGFTVSVRIAAAPAVIFPYFTDPAFMVQWIGERAALEPTPGGEFAVDFERERVRGSYVAIDPPHRVVFTWGIAGDDGFPPGTSTVEVTLHAEGQDTIVELVHRGIPQPRQSDHRAGWTRLLALLGTKAS